MSIAGRNHFRGSTVHVMRPFRAEGEGAQTAETWVAHRTNLRIELLAASDEVARRIFGEEADIQVAAIVPASTEIANNDGVIVTSGEYAGQRFRVVAARSLKRFIELGLQSTTETIEDPEEVAA
jgi:hypothetical protein